MALTNSLVYNATPIALLPALSSATDLVHSLRASKATHLFVQSDLLPRALEAAREIGLPDDRIYLLDGRVEGRKSFLDFLSDFRGRGLPLQPVAPVARDTLAYVTFAHGGTGIPQGQLPSWVVYAEHRLIFAIFSRSNYARSYLGNDIS